MDEKRKILLAGCREIVEYANAHPGTSYYDVKAYAYENNLEHWIGAMNDSKIRNNISICLREIRRRSRIPYKNDLVESEFRAEKAVDDYNRRHSVCDI